MPNLPYLSFAFIMQFSWSSHCFLSLCFLWRHRPFGPVRLFVAVPRSRTIRHTPGRNLLNEWSACHRSLYLHNTTNKVDEQPDSNPRSQQSGCRRPTPYTARPLGSGFLWRSLKHSQVHPVSAREKGQNNRQSYSLFILPARYVFK
jgi:hypothetical protein